MRPGFSFWDHYAPLRFVILIELNARALIVRVNGGWRPRWSNGPENRANGNVEGSIPSPSASIAGRSHRVILNIPRWHNMPAIQAALQPEGGLFI